MVAADRCYAARSADAVSTSATPRGAGCRQPSRVWRLRQFRDMELLRGRFYSHAYPRHIHDTFSVGVNENVPTTFFYRGVHHVAPAGAITLVNPGEVHTGQALRECAWYYRSLYPSAELLGELAGDVGAGHARTPFFPDPVIVDPRLADSLLRAHRISEHPRDGLEQDCELVGVLGDLLRRHSDLRVSGCTHRPERPAVRLAREYIEAYCSAKIVLQSLADLVGLSKYHFIRVFREATGLSPAQYQTQVRIQQAKGLLRQGHPISGVAARLGFSDQSHFTRQFKRWVGVTPGHYLC